MATSTLIQFVATEAQGASATTSNRTVVETFIANGTITKGDFVALDTTVTGSDRVLKVIQAAAVAVVGNSLTIGVALSTVGSGDQVNVCIGGYCATAYVDGATVAGSAICGPIGTAGQGALAVAASTAPVIAVALEADTANYAAVFVTRVF